MSEIGVFTPEQARLLWQDYMQRQQLGPHLTKNYPQRGTLEEPATHRVLVKNTESEAIPPYACMRVTGTEEVAGRTVVTVEKPTSLDGEFLFNSQFEIPVYAAATESTPETTGVGWAYRYGVVVMLGDGTTAEAGTRYTPKIGEWYAEVGDGPFVAFGDHNAATDAVIGHRFMGSGMKIVRFSYVSSDGIASAICEIRSRPHGGSVPDTILDGTAIIVHDPNGCSFVGPEEDLTGRFGWAAYMTSDEVMPDQEYPEPHWEVVDFCCDDSECYE